MSKLAAVSFTAVRQQGFGGLVLYSWAALKYTIPSLITQAFRCVSRGTGARDVTFKQILS